MPTVADVSDICDERNVNLEMGGNYDKDSEKPCRSCAGEILGKISHVIISFEVIRWGLFSNKNILLSLCLSFK